jgi:hypothetical protein
MNDFWDRTNDWLLHTTAGILTAIAVQVAIAAVLVSLLT